MWSGMWIRVIWMRIHIRMCIWICRRVCIRMCIGMWIGMWNRIGIWIWIGMGEQAVDRGVKYRMGIAIWIRIQVWRLVTRWLSAGGTRMPLAEGDGKDIRGLRSRWHGCGNG